MGIKLCNVGYKIRRKNILSNINLTINDGDKIAIVGANGSGKTILSEIISGILKPTTGKVFIKIPPP